MCISDIPYLFQKYFATAQPQKVLEIKSRDKQKS